jgi:hypothetical protein
MSDSANVSQSGIIKRLENKLELAMQRALMAFAAGKNSVTFIPTGTGAPAAPTYIAIAAPAITKKSTGKYRVQGFVTIDKNGGTLAAGDGVVLQPFLNNAELSTFQVATAAVASDATVQAFCAFSFITDQSGAAGPFNFDMRVTHAGAAHTSSVLVNNGFISVTEV